MFITQVFTMQLSAKTEEIKRCLNACRCMTEVDSHVCMRTKGTTKKKYFTEAMETNQMSSHNGSN